MGWGGGMSVGYHRRLYLQRDREERKGCFEFAMKPIERIAALSIGEAPYLSLPVLRALPVKTIAARLWEGRLRPKGNHGLLERSQASFLSTRAYRFEVSPEQPAEDGLSSAATSNPLSSNHLSSV